MYKKCILFLLVGLVAGGSSTNAGRWTKREADLSEFSSSAYKGVSSSPSNEQNQDSFSPLNASEIESDNGLLEMMNKKKEELRQDLNSLLFHWIASQFSTLAERRSRRETDPSVAPSPTYEGVSSSPFNVQNQDSSTPLNASEIESDNGLLEKMYKKKEQLKKDLNLLRLITRLSTSVGRRSRREADPSAVPSPAYEDMSSSPFNVQNQDSSTPINASEIESDNGVLEKFYNREECFNRFKVCLVADAPSANGGERSSTTNKQCQESTSPSSGQNQDSSTPLNASEIESDNGLLERINKRKECAISLKMCLLAGASSVNGGESLSTLNKQSQGSSSPSNGQSQEYTESATPMSNGNENVSDDELLNKTMKVKELLRKALEKYDEVNNKCTRDLDLSLRDILFYKNQIDKYIIQQNK